MLVAQQFLEKKINGKNLVLANKIMITKVVKK
jgi:hypothetical protein